MRTRTLILTLAVALAAVVPARAQNGGGGGTERAQTTGSGVGLRAFFLFDRVSMTAADSFEAALETSTLNGFGGGVDVTRLWQRLFARVAVSRLSGDGERVIVVDGERIPLGVPLEVKMTPIELGAGWRVPIGRAGRVAAYGGAGLLRLSYKETSEDADSDEDIDESFNGSVVFGGVDFDLSRGFMAGVEAQFRSVPDAIGEGGLSREFDETNLGGFAIRFVIGFRR
jgi:opacity protein-like surface antigen